MNANDKTQTSDVTKVLEAGIKAVSPSTLYNDLYWVNGYTQAFDNDSLVNIDEQNGAAFADYRVDNATKYFTVTTTIWNNGADTTQYVEITASEANDLTADQQVVVAYDQNNYGDKVAAYVYILKTVTNGTDSPADDWYTYKVGASSVEVNNKTLEVYVSDANMTVAQLTAAGLTTSGHYYTTTDGVRSEVAVANNSTATILSIMAQDGAALTAVNGWNVSFTIVTSK